MFGTVKTYIIGIGVAILGVLYAITKYQSSKIETLEEENKTKAKKLSIAKEMEGAQKLAEVKESESIKETDLSDWRDKI